MIVKDSVALVTGGASGLGLATVKALHDQGASVVILDLPSSNGEFVAKELGDRVRFAAGDVTDEASVVAALDRPNPSARCASRSTARHRQRHQDGRQAGRLPARGVPARRQHQPGRHVQRPPPGGRAHREDRPDRGGERGVIINTASVAAFDGQIGQAAYSASKAASSA